MAFKTYSCLLLLLVSGCAQNEMNFDSYGIQVLDLSKDNYVIIDKNGDTIVYNKIVKFCKKNKKIIGFRTYYEGDNSINSPEFTENLGYFELDLKSKRVEYYPEFEISRVDYVCRGETVIE